MTPREFFDHVVQAAPSFDTVRGDHLAANEELLPHLLMADVLRYLQTHYSRDPLWGAQPPTMEESVAVFGILDRGMLQGNDDTVNAIQVSFVEGIDNEAYFEQLEPLFGDAIRNELHRQRTWWEQHGNDVKNWNDAR